MVRPRFLTMNIAQNLFNARQEFTFGNGKRGAFYSLPALEKAGVQLDEKKRIKVGP